jgi:hypothetical protein
LDWIESNENNYFILISGEGVLLIEKSKNFFFSNFDENIFQIFYYIFLFLKIFKFLLVPAFRIKKFQGDYLTVQLIVFHVYLKPYAETVLFL